MKLLNPTNGSWWFVQILSKNAQLAEFPNPTNGSWWIVQILSKVVQKIR
jgi:hypothetical protein